MPRPGHPRTVSHETNLARRIAFERERRDWTYEALAHRMSTAGCPVPVSALFKIEKGEPARRINVDEFMTLARVFEIEPMELLCHPDEVENAALRSAMSELREAEAKAMPGLKLIQQKLGAVSLELEHRPHHRESVAPALGDLTAGLGELYEDLVTRMLQLQMADRLSNLPVRHTEVTGG